MSSLKAFLPDASVVLSMHVSDLAGYVLEAIVSSYQADRSVLHIRNFCNAQATAYAPHREFNRPIGLKCAEAFAWLVHNGMLCQDFEQDQGWHVLTALGTRVAQRARFAEYVASSELPESFLHPLIATIARPLFLQGRFDTAVFEAFRELEVEMRDAAKLGSDLVGRKLAQQAFAQGTGPLADPNAESGEKTALMELMSGALGSFKNPTSHRRVGLDAASARDLLILASRLLTIVDERRASASKRRAKRGTRTKK